MAENFFSGGTMPSSDLLLHFQRDLQVINRWNISGLHYEKTSNDWLSNLDKNASQVKAIFTKTYGEQQAALWVNKWRMFFMACAEMFAFNYGEEWFIALYLFKKINN